MNSRILLLCAALVASAFIFTPKMASAAPRDIRFPVIGPVSFSNDFGAPRVGHTHEGNDIFGYKGQPLVAAVTGTIRYVAYPQPTWGYAVTIRANDGWTYHYLHINNDNPGTDDGQGGGMNAYAPDMVRSFPIVAGQLIGWMGDSGNAEGTPPHLHFEIRDPNGSPINPFETLWWAPRLSAPANYPAINDEILPFGNFKGGSSIALGEFSTRYAGDEIVAGAGPGGAPHVKVFSQTGKRISQFFAFEDSVRGGLDVAVGDTNKDGINEIIVAAGENSSPRVRIFNDQGVLQKEFFAFESWFRGGVRIAAADLNNDGRVEILTSPAKDYAPWVKRYTATGKNVGEFLAYDKGFKGGVDVAAIEKTETSDAFIVTGAGRGGGPHVRIFDPIGNRKYQFFAYPLEFRGGVRVAITDISESNGGLEIVTAPASNGGPDFGLFSIKGKRLASYTTFERWWRGGYNIAAHDGRLFVASQGGRRATIRPLE